MSFSPSDSPSEWLNFNAIVKACYVNSQAHGFWTEETHAERLKTIPAKLMLIVSEAAEALEEYRRRGDVATWYPDMGDGSSEAVDWRTEMPKKPEGVPSELADIVIRVFDLAEALNIDLAEAVRAKMIYNETRPFRHGGKTI